MTLRLALATHHYLISSLLLYLPHFSTGDDNKKESILKNFPLDVWVYNTDISVPSPIILSYINYTQAHYMPLPLLLLTVPLENQVCYNEE